ncbi:hypothetical protein [Nocardiopsis metallicus]|uniref:Uncharacterized protein n=1 Tax=Nocardiopsis metallicus TaxID=179819 RepID=A0A840WET3_9ACTN|nr:hypothetical protein [Nocardiopsis metallicus]MBB5490217.1 hypothetical protein [Nocardiopsis metallicus]
MVDEFRAAFQELIDASVATDPQQFPPAVHKVYLLASQIPASERELALEALTPLLSGDHAAPGIIADLSVVAGALVEMGTDPGPAGIETLHRLRTMGKGAIVFVRAWERTGGGTPPDPDAVTADAEARVAADLGPDAPAATMCWWTIRRHGLAARTMLSESSVRAHIRRDPSLHAELVAIANQLSDLLTEFDEVRALLRMAEATSALVMDRASSRAFRVLFDGIGDNFQLHTLLADALIGPNGQGLSGEAPDPRWTASFRDGPVDPTAQTVWGWWNMVAHDGSWVWNEGVPAEIPTVDGEHVLVLDEQPYPRSWTAGRRHMHVRGWLEVESELSREEAELWWKRVAPAEPAIPDPEDHTPLPEPVVLQPPGPAPDAQRVRGFLPEAKAQAAQDPQSASEAAGPAPATPEALNPDAVSSATAGSAQASAEHAEDQAPLQTPQPLVEPPAAEQTPAPEGAGDAPPQPEPEPDIAAPAPVTTGPEFTFEDRARPQNPFEAAHETGGQPGDGLTAQIPVVADTEPDPDTAEAEEPEGPEGPDPEDTGAQAPPAANPNTTSTGLPRMPRGVSQSSAWGPTWR